MIGRVASLRSGREEMASLGPAGLMFVGKHDGEELEKRQEVFNMRRTFHLVERNINARFSERAPSGDPHT